LAISEREQRRIGQDLHDGICQELAAVHFALESAKKIAGPSSRLAAQLQVISQGIHRAIHHTRLISRGLAPYELEDGDLAGALRELAETTGTLHEISCALQTHGPIPAFDPETATHLFRITQEAIQNAIRHGGATVIEIALDFSGIEARLAVHDNGCGLPEASSAAPGRGMGWKIMQHRATLLGGVVEIGLGKNGRGTAIRCIFPA
jgi:signal transduction histidine kinase